MSIERKVALTPHINLYEVVDQKVKEIIFSDRDVYYKQPIHFFVGFVPANRVNAYVLEVTLFDPKQFRPLNNRTAEYAELEETCVKQILEKYIPEVIKFKKRPGTLIRFLSSIFGTLRG